MRQTQHAMVSEGKARDTLRRLAVRELHHDPTRAAAFLGEVAPREEPSNWQAEAWHILQHPLGEQIVATGDLAAEQGSTRASASSPARRPGYRCTRTRTPPRCSPAWA